MARLNILCGRLGSSTYHDPHTTVIIWDNGASFRLKLLKIDLIDNVKCNTPLKDATKDNTVIGIGITIHKFVDANGKYVFLPSVIIISQTRMCNFSLHKLIIIFMVITPSLKDLMLNGTEEPFNIKSFNYGVITMKMIISFLERKNAHPCLGMIVNAR